MTKTGQYVILKPGITNDPAAWGLVLADIMGHIANAYEQVEGAIDRKPSNAFEPGWKQSYRLQRIDHGVYSRAASRNDPISDHDCRQRFDICQRFLARRAVGHHSWQVDQLCDPAAVRFSIKLDAKLGG